ncbi:Necrosis inducing protein NPP1 type [Phytophthora cinnamomi]|uniref:Necrosis inducing protein NPP1 type n=1 Tax=Phytophthora cinnamomi TaxID=4785 RepID=UPI00355953BC|nr:Necrosis inducing protein NPP1 type [Phytophthora cinnamomi]
MHPPQRSSCLALLLLLGAMGVRVVAAQTPPELAPLDDVLADQAAIPSPFSPEDAQQLVEVAATQLEDGFFVSDVDDELQLLDGEEAIIAAAPVSPPDTFEPMDTRSDEVQELVGQFMLQYQHEVGRTALKASVLQVLKAEKTQPREEVQEIEMGTANGNDLQLVQTDVSEVMRVFLLVDYGFQSSMMDAKRPYVSVLKLTMDCVNASTEQEADVECDLLEHLDLPRHKAEVGKAVQRTIAEAAPASFLKSHSLNVKYDAVEQQDIATDNEGDIETMTYVRYRVQAADGKFSDDDCMVVVQQARGITTLMFTDTVCFDSATKSAVMAAYEYASNNLPVGALIFAAVCGALVAVVVLIRHRRKNQRFGYSYVRSKAPSHVPTQGAAATGVKYVDADSPAIAC